MPVRLYQAQPEGLPLALPIPALQEMAREMTGHNAYKRLLWSYMLHVRVVFSEC